jgi:hypothetical protein
MIAAFSRDRRCQLLFRKILTNPSNAAAVDDLKNKCTLRLMSAFVAPSTVKRDVIVIGGGKGMKRRLISIAKA